MDRIPIFSIIPIVFIYNILEIYLRELSANTVIRFARDQIFKCGIQ